MANRRKVRALWLAFVSIYMYFVAQLLERVSAELFGKHVARQQMKNVYLVTWSAFRRARCVLRLATCNAHGEDASGGQQRVVVVVIAKRSKIKYFFMFLPGNLDMVLEYLYRALCPPCVMRICMCDPCVAQFCAEETENEVPRRAAYESCVLLILKIY